jgi:hypothetical protein
MASVPEEPQTWSIEGEAERLAEALRHEIDSVKNQLEDYRREMLAAGLSFESEQG